MSKKIVSRKMQAIEESIKCLEKLGNFDKAEIDKDGSLHLTSHWGWFDFEDITALAEIVQKHKLGIHFEGEVFIFEYEDEEEAAE